MPSALYPRAAAALLACATASPAYAEIIATCGASTGKALYSGSGDQWADEGISQGSFTFTRDIKGNINVLYHDARGGTVDAAADGASVRMTYDVPELREFTVVVDYGPDVGLVETFNVVAGPGGTRRLLWTANRSGGSGVPKVSAFAASCP